MNDRRSFSWLKALGHAFAIATVFLVPALGFSIAGVVDATKAGEFSGGFVMGGFILGWIWSYARQRAHSTAKSLLTFVLVAMSAYEVFVLASAAARRSKLPPVSALEKFPPTSHQTAGGLVLCQQDVGFRIALGNISLSPAPDLAETLKQIAPGDTVARWVYREESGDVVMLTAARGFHSEESLHNFAKGVSSAAGGRMTKVHESVEWASDHGTIVISLRQTEGGRFDVRCVSAANGNLACAQTMGSGPDRLANLRRDLSFGSCP